MIRVALFLALAFAVAIGLAYVVVGEIGQVVAGAGL